MWLPEVRHAVPADVHQMAELHIATSRQAYAGLIPDHALRAVGRTERARRWADSLTTAGSEEAIMVVQSNARILALGHCGPQRTPSLPFAGEFYCLYVLPEAQRHGVGSALMIAMARFLASHGMNSASLWVARDNAPARRFYERLGGALCAERDDARPDYVLAEVACGWRDLSVVAVPQ